MSVVFYRLGKFNSVGLAAALVTAALFYLMQALILTQEGMPAPTARRIIADISIPEPELIVLTKTPKLEQVEPPEKLPPLPPLETDVAGEKYSTGISVPVVVLTDDFGGVPELAEGSALALVKTAPSYPVRAAQRGIEGYVVLEFDVDANGSVIDPRVLYAEPSGYFESAALRALGRWKYKPKVVSGEAVKMFGVQQKMTFTLEQ